LRRNIVNKTPEKPTTAWEKELEKIKKRGLTRKRKLQGYDPLTKEYSKSLTFPGPDSSVALLTIRDFSEGDYEDYYERTFSKLNFYDTKTLILDLRDNPGGRISDAFELYSYLSRQDFSFIRPPVVTSKLSLAQFNFFRGRTLTEGLSIFLGLPLITIQTAFILSKVNEGRDGRYYYNMNESRFWERRPERFRGKVYVLINGGSFSASCILASNLKGSGRAKFVGEETGGAYNGTVAGRLPAFILPHSKLPIVFGLMTIEPFYQAGLPGRGIFPDVEIKPTLEDRIQGKDPELQWILDELKRKT